MPYSTSLLSIPAYYFLATYPHAHAIFISTHNKIAIHDNRNPKSTDQIQKIKARLSPRDFAAYERAERCHSNALENMPLFVAAVFAGVLAEQKAGRSLGTENFALAWLAVRTLYTIAYLKIESRNLSLIRSGLYFVGTFLCFGMIGRAAWWLP